MQNNFKELHTLMNFIRPHYLPPYRAFKFFILIFNIFMFKNVFYLYRSAFVDPISTGQQLSADRIAIGRCTV